MATAAVNAAAEDECPEGNEDDVGMSTPRFGLSQTRAGGRRRGKRGLSMPLASALEPASASSPRAAALRGRPPIIASKAATTIHKTP